MAQRSKKGPEDEITVGFKAAQQYAEWVHTAARRANMSASKYLQQVVLRAAGTDIGIPREEINRALEPVKPASALVAEAAKRAGVTPREYARRAAVEAARALLDESAPTVPKRLAKRRAG